MTSADSESKQNVVNVFLTFLKLGFTSFGGPVAHLGYFHKELVEKQKWVSESQYGQLLAICQFLPGPASSQLGFALGLLRGGWLGALSAFLAFTLPSAILLIVFASLLPSLSSGIGEAAIHGLKLVACAVVADAVLGMSQKLCGDTSRRSIAVIAAALTLTLDSALFQIAVVLFGAFAGLVLCKNAANETGPGIQVPYGKQLSYTLFAIFFALLFCLPLFANTSTTAAIADVFYRAGALVFGGGHVVLPLLEESIVGTGWLSQGDFLAGYGGSQAIPGPMFAFSAYLGALIPGENSGLLNAATALAFMFVPGFILVIAALPLWQRISHNPRALNAIAGINAAVVGLLAAALYDPIFTTGISSAVDLAIAIIGFGMLRIWKLSALYVVLWCVVASVFSAFI